MRKKRANQNARNIYNYSLTIDCNYCQKGDKKKLPSDKSVLGYIIARSFSTN